MDEQDTTIEVKICMDKYYNLENYAWVGNKFCILKKIMHRKLFILTDSRNFNSNKYTPLYGSYESECLKFPILVLE